MSKLLRGPGGRVLKLKTPPSSGGGGTTPATFHVLTRTGDRIVLRDGSFLAKRAGQ